MVSEDSQHLRWLPMIHRLRDLRDLDETRHLEVPSEIHQLDDLGELGEVLSFRRSQRVRLEEWNDHIPQVSEAGDGIAVEMFAMVVVAAVQIHPPAAEER